MPRDWLVDAIDEVLAARAEVRVALDAVIDEMKQARKQRLAGASLTELLASNLVPGGPTRARAAEAFHELERATARVRARAIQEMVDTDGMTFTEAARQIGVSRQLAARMYKDAKEGPSK